MTDLGAFLADAARRPWEWRVHDCSAFPAQWAGVLDALPDYANEAEAETLLQAAGGLAPLWDQHLAGLAAEVEPRGVEPGDIGVIELVGPDLTMAEVGAIWTGQRWAYAPARGGVAAVGDAVCLKAWRPLCPR